MRKGRFALLKQLKINRESGVADLVAGLTVALVTIPENLGFALVAGVCQVRRGPTSIETQYEEFFGDKGHAVDDHLA